MIDSAPVPPESPGVVNDYADAVDSDSSEITGGAPPIAAASPLSMSPPPAPADADLPDDDAAFLASARLSPFKQMITTVTSSRRNMAVAAGALGLVFLVSTLAFCGGGGSDKPKKVAAAKEPAVAPAKPEPAPEPVEKAAEPAANPATPTEPTPSGPTPEELAAATGDTGEATADPAPSTATATTATTTTATATTATATKRDTGGKTGTTTGTTTGATTPAKKDTIGGKQVVLEYDTQARESKPVATAPKSDQGAISKARAAYASGNQRLFAGDPGGAIKFYRQSLAHYPAYVAGYRGLGLAYAQQGDKPKALQALRMYVSAVPGAKDAALIRKRITTLQGK